LATPAIARNVPPTVPCRICGRNFGTRSIKIHEPQCNKRWQVQSQQKNQVSYRQKSADSAQGNSSSMYPVSLEDRKHTRFNFWTRVTVHLSYSTRINVLLLQSVFLMTFPWHLSQIILEFLYKRSFYHARNKASKIALR